LNGLLHNKTNNILLMNEKIVLEVKRLIVPLNAF